MVIGRNVKSAGPRAQPPTPPPCTSSKPARAASTAGLLASTQSPMGTTRSASVRPSGSRP
ncbi:hypothetical protein FB465_4285 [Kitasatospora atroaurantiaca]|uniref:Uncharacterized protein n=1 Tax=Kitasatospora atroaurantiaca TaxID=285545 RepID=A0A561EU82_9ACTN|nr:hypothetical protein FB465_4285 [Kitasatospora atroaurantiaca]